VSEDSIIILGYSGHGNVVAEAALNAGLNLKYYADKNEIEPNVFSLEYIGFEKNEDFEGWNHDCGFILGIGDNTIRSNVAASILKKGKHLLNVIHPDASVSKHIKIGTGNFISKNVSVNPLAVIGDGTILNTGCIIEHECEISSGVHIGPGAVLCGNVKIGENSFVGANAVVVPGIEVGKNVCIGAGAVVVKNIPDDSGTWIGNPAKKLR
jgi:sugar O-acyltransferase (sialic acid O-acetyltransferase NeuD family)